ncbi:hypothetical protein ABIB26_001827 [Arthrobacter sp. UYEF20]
MTQNWLILKNGETVIGLFQGMFELNMLTFNPGWNQNAEAVYPFTDVRELQRELKAKGTEFLFWGGRGNGGAGELYRPGPGRQPGSRRSARPICEGPRQAECPVSTAPSTSGRRRGPAVVRSLRPQNFWKRLASGSAMQTPTLVNPHCGGCPTAPRCSYER